MKIGIITIHNSPNYGACLQSYALYKYITQLGHQVEIIDLYRPTHIGYVNSKNFIFQSRKQLTLFDKAKKCIKKIFRYPTFKSQKNVLTEEAKLKFDDFNAMINFSTPYKCIDELYKNPPSYDMYITGSDQVWNPTQRYCIEPYFLNFVKNGGRKISYASSIGVDNILKSEEELFKKYLSQYDYVSVREKNAKILLENLIDKDIYQVLDPTFLLSADEWKTMAIQNTKNINRYIFLFTLSYNDKLFKYVTRLKKESGLNLVVLCGRKTDLIDCDECYNIIDAGPKDFLGLINNADLVITNSFHCTALSIILQAKNFGVYIEEGDKRGVRITDLLDSFSLQSHVLESDLLQNYACLMSDTIDHSFVYDQYLKEQKKSREFLNMCMANGTNL